jgi:hypothetical protein
MSSLQLNSRAHSHNAVSGHSTKYRPRVSHAHIRIAEKLRQSGIMHNGPDVASSGKALRADRVTTVAAVAWILFRKFAVHAF